jgi:hypothetical protein
MRTLNLALFASLTLLTACGGGGSSPSATSTPTTTVHTSSNGDRTTTTVTHALNNESSVSAISFAGDSSNFSYGSQTDLSNYVLDNGTHTFAVSSSGITSTNLATLSANAGNQQVLLGGSAWSYARYGLMVDKTPNSNNLNTQYVIRHMPYVRYLRHPSAVFTNATYNLTGSKAVGGFLVSSNRWATVTCDVSVAATSTGGESTSIDITLSACDNGIATTGYLRLTKSTITGLASASLGTFGATSNGNTFTPSVPQGFYGVAGPNSEDLVGHIVVHGSTLVSGVALPTRFTLAFGARK